MERVVVQNAFAVLVAALLVSVAVLLAARPAHGSSPGGLSRCTEMKYKAVGRAIRAAYRCEGQVIRGTAQGNCRTPIVERLETDLTRADRFGPCPGGVAAGAAAGCTPYLRAGGDLACRLAKLRAASRMSIGRLDCHRESVRTGAPLADCFARQAAKFLAAYAHAERPSGFCGDAFNGTAEQIEGRVDRCVSLAAVPLSCGNGELDPGEQCDGQPFCQPFACGINLPVCCQLPMPPEGACVATLPAVEVCMSLGGTLGVGFCPDNPCPGDSFPGCMIGVCADPPIPPTSACCQQGDTCKASSVASTLGLRSELLACATSGGTATLGTCGSDGRCVRH